MKKDTRLIIKHLKSLPKLKVKDTEKFMRSLWCKIRGYNERTNKGNIEA